MFPLILTGLISTKGGIPYVASQSSVYSPSVLGTYENLTDLDSTTGAGTNVGGTQWIKATYPIDVTFTSVTVAGGTMPTWGDVSPFLNGATFQYSTDDLNWNDLVTITGVTNSGPDLRKTFPFPATTAKYWRLAFNNYLSTTEIILQ